MNIETEIIEIEQRLLDDKIGWDEARSEIARVIDQKNLKKPWQRSQWKRERDALIGDKCTQCGSKKKPLVLQHLWHPRGFDKILQDLVGQDTWLDFKREYKLKISADFLVDRNSCPECGSLNVRNRKTMSPPWCCDKCGTGFEEPRVTKAFTKESREKFKYGNDDYKTFIQKQMQEFIRLYGSQYGKKAVLISIAENRRYLSFSDTTTFCKRCAFLWDEYRIRHSQVKKYLSGT